MQEVKNEFQQFEFTATEYANAIQFTDLQRAMMQTTLAEKAHARLALTFDPLAAHEFVQNEAYLKGQMELLVELLNPAISEVEAATPLYHQPQ